MDDHSISWASLLYVAITAGALGYILGAASALAVGGAVRRERIAMAALAIQHTATERCD